MGRLCHRRVDGRLVVGRGVPLGAGDQHREQEQGEQEQGRPDGGGLRDLDQELVQNGLHGRHLTERMW
ncbi:hypothetical protein MRQ36_22625 [Micromonospora sp. R77]|uniref:hypothetical protein n=1 Tax=Micromonospora sp. R77 TaxID=2925836 RepID=UPI001F61362D|nr:hypothetical protein [Micromonospora sp. R77]MCI4065206.1 hypothetical protein [Micromonospora sp. R77]